MARHPSVKRNQRLRNAGAVRRVAGVGTAAGAFLAFGLTAFATAPAANADELDLILDPLLDSVSNIDSTMGTDFSALVSSFDPGFAGDQAANASPDLAQLLDQFVYAPVHTAEQAWITSPFGERVDDLINTTFGENIIGNGAPGTAVHPDGGAGGLLFGDGGNGWSSDSAGTAGGNGGAAFFGNGGDGGDGGAGADGGDGGDTQFGIGGDGGDGGDGSNPGGLPALGGAGGNGGLLGSHGAVGHYGTVAGHPPSASSDVSTTGPWLTDSDGKVVILHGLNEVYKVPPYEPSASGFSDDDAAFLADNGFNAVRLGIIWAAVEPQPGVFNDAYLASIAQTVQTLADHGIVTELAMQQDLYSSTFGGEGAPEWATQTGGLPNPDLGFPLTYYFNPAEQHAWDAFWSNANGPDGVGLENSYAQMAEHVADYFKDNPDVVGFEMASEPFPGSSWLQTLFGNPHFDAQQLTPFYNQVASAIRAVDPTTPIFLEPNGLFDFGVPTHLGTVDAAQTVFGFDAFCPVSSVPLCALFDDVAMKNAEAYAGSHAIPAFLTSFGSTDNDTILTNMMQAANQNHMGWLEWEYTAKDDMTSTGQPALVFDPDKPPVGDNVDTAKLAALAEPYPQLVSGTPNSWSFDPGGSDTFHLSYSTERADGDGSFAAGARTSISVPAIEYPNGYAVSVTGGHVVSDPNAAELLIASNPGANTVTVTVSAAPAAG